MFTEQPQNRRDRRGDYSFKKHLARLKREGRLPQIGLGTMAVVLMAAVTFGRCESSITGPETEADAGSVESPSLHGTGMPGTDVFKQRTVERNVVFVGVNPCNGDAVRAEGTRYESLTLITREEAGYFESRSKIRDYFRGYAINDPVPPPTRYKGEDEHEHNEIISPTRLESEVETHEHLVAIGPEPDWKLFFYERRRTDPLQPWNTRVDYRAKASCSHQCSLPEGCIDREMSLASFSEREVPSIPLATTLP
jgi:hypothetical protein